jgi:hypothetical protein
MRALPQTDVELGSILGFNNPTNGFHDARLIAESLRARLVVPGHHDFLLPYSGSAYQTAFRTEMNETPAAVAARHPVGGRPGRLHPARAAHVLRERPGLGGDGTRSSLTRELPVGQPRRAVGGVAEAAMPVGLVVL